MNKIIRIQEDCRVDDRLFQHGQEYEYTVKYMGNLSIDDPCVIKGIFWRIDIDGEIYDIPETVAVEGSATDIEYNNLPDKNIHEYNSAKSWGEKVTEDAITKYYGSYNFVGAAKFFLDKDIRAKKRADQADYAVR